MITDYSSVKEQRPILANRCLFPEKRRRFFGSNIDLLTMDETAMAVERILQERVPTQHVVVNVAKLMMMRKDEELSEIVNSCSLVNVDGQGVVWGARWLGILVPERVTGIDLFFRLVELSARKGYRLYFLGAQQEVVQEVVRLFTERYPSLQVVGWRNGYFKPVDEAGIVEDIRDSRADILFVAMNSPQKELFLKKYTQTMNVPFTMGVGGSFDVAAGRTQRAPVWMQKAGLERFYRLLSEPARMTSRYVVSNSIFFMLLLKAKLFGKKKYGCE